MTLLKHWLDELEDLFRSFSGDVKGPVCFLIGAGASLSSGTPTTVAVVNALMAAQPGLFPDRTSVYEQVHRLSTDLRRQITNRLFGGVVPHVGYRCMAAMARSRPIIVVNLNWDNCPIDACARLGLPPDAAVAVDLEDTAKVAAELERLLRRGNGLLSVHVHGRLNDPEGRSPRFGTRETLDFNDAEFEQLRRLLNFRTLVVGTSLTGHHDVPKLIKALLPPQPESDGGVKRLWVVERSEAARLPSPETEAGRELTRALADRHSPSYFVASPDVDFDMFMVALRAGEVGFTWNDVKKESGGSLPERSELVPPNPEVVRPLLDAPGVLVGRADVGKGAVSHQVAHWHAILAETPRPLLEAAGGEAILAAIAAAANEDPVPVIVGEHCYGRDSFHSCPDLIAALEELGTPPGVVLTSRPPAWFDMLNEDPSLMQRIRMIPFQASQVWVESSLRAYARRQASPWRVANIEEAIEREELVTPQQVDRVMDAAHGPSHDLQEQRRLTSYLKRLREEDEGKALGLALIRLQDMAHAVPRSQLAEACGDDCDLSELVQDPWELVTAIEIDDEYLRLARREAVVALDRWMGSDREWLAGRIAILGERWRWAREALGRWERLRSFDPKRALDEFDAETIELLGPELIEPALDISPKKAMSVLRVMFDTAADAWALREVAFELVRRWETLRTCPKAHELRDDFIADTGRRGTYALFEGMLRYGGIAPRELWSPVFTAVLAMSRRLDEDGNRRQVALCFDALLWRPAPVDLQEDRGLLDLLLEAAQGDDLLWAACAAGAAYHSEGAQRLSELGLDNPIETLGRVGEAEAVEMAWVVEWHFIHQSRNRALASRRYFRSTRKAPAASGQARLLSRRPLGERKLPAEVARGVQKVVAELGRFPATAGWAIHMVMNVHATAGLFHVEKLGDIFSKARVDDPGLIWAAVTYRPERRLKEALTRKLCNKDGRDSVQAALSGEIELEGVAIARPRFAATLDPWLEVRSRLEMNADLLGDLGFAAGEPWRLVEVVRGLREAVVEVTGDEEIFDYVIERLANGDARLIEHVHSSESWFREPARKQSRQTPAELEENIKSLIVLVTHLVAAERETR